MVKHAALSTQTVWPRTATEEELDRPSAEICQQVPCSMNARILWNLACHGYPRLPCWGWMITIEGAAGSAFKQQRGDGGLMGTGPCVLSGSSQIKIENSATVIKVPQLIGVIPRD